MTGFRLLPLLAAVALIAGCSSEPVSVRQAMEMCKEPARKAGGPTGTVGLGFDSEGGVSSSLSIELTDDYLFGRDPDEVFEECVVKLSGSVPDHPYSELVGNG